MSGSLALLFCGLYGEISMNFSSVLDLSIEYFLILFSKELLCYINLSIDNQFDDRNGSSFDHFDFGYPR